MQVKSDDYIRNSFWISGSSLPEQLLYRSLIQIFPRAINRAIEMVINTEFDIVVPELKLRIEYSGEFWHKDKEERDQLRREYCKQNRINYVEILDKPGAIGIEIEKNDLHIMYCLHNNGDYRYITNNIRVIIENICENFGINDYINIDYNQSLYEAILFSSKYIFRLLRNNEHEIIGREYVKAKDVNYYVKQDYQTLRLDKISREHLGLMFYNDIESKNIVLTVEDTDNLSNLAFSGDTLENCGLSPKISIAEKERKLMRKETYLEKEEYRLEKLAESIEKRKEEIEQLEKQLEMRVDAINRDYDKLKAAEAKFNSKLHKIRSLYQRMSNRENKAERELLKYQKLQEELKKERIEIRQALEQVKSYEKIRKVREYWSKSIEG